MLWCSARSQASYVGIWVQVSLIHFPIQCSAKAPVERAEDGTNDWDKDLGSEH